MGVFNFLNPKKLTSSSQGTVKVLSGAPRQAMTSSYYLYGIAELGKQVVLYSKAIDSSDSKVFTLPFKDICAVLSRSRYQEYDPSDENLLTHNHVLQELHEAYGCTVLPIKFSTIAKTDADVRKILVTGYPKFKIKLSSLKSKAELAVKVYCKIGSLRDSILQSRKCKEGSKELEEEMRKQSVKFANSLLDSLRPISADFLLNDLVFDDLILNAAFLIEEKRTKEFISTIKNYEVSNQKVLKVEWSGPYVPYSFTDPPK